LVRLHDSLIIDLQNKEIHHVEENVAAIRFESGFYCFRLEP
jgi:hypothetical protein